MSSPPPQNVNLEQQDAPESGSDAENVPRPRFDKRALLVLVVLLVIAGGVAVLTTGSSNSSKPPGSTNAKQTAYHAAGVFSPPRTAPPIKLHNYLGQPVSLSQYRGKAVLVTFLYTNCPDVCPLITSNLRVAQNVMGPKVSSEAQIVAVSVDPHGDTPKAVAAFLARHGMTGRMQYLIGSAKELAKVWKAWGVGSEEDAEQPQFVNHTGIVYGISASGKQTTFYAPEFKPNEIAHDVPLLASE